MKRKGHKGFTLMEMMVVVLILCVLAAIAYPLYTKSVAKSKVVEAVNLLEMLKTRQSQYQAKNGDYFTVIPTDMRFTNKQLKMEGTTSGDFEFYNSEGNYRKIGKGFKMTLSKGADQNCAVVTYNRAGVSFQVSSAYDRPEIGCTGSVCSSFGEIFGIGGVKEVKSVCNCAEMPAQDENGCALDYSNCIYSTNCTSGNGDCVTAKPQATAICSQIGDNCVCTTPLYVCVGGSWIQDGANETSTPKPTKPAEACASGDGEKEKIFIGTCTNSGWTEAWTTGQCKCKDATKTLYTDADGIQKCGTKCTTDMCSDPMIRNNNSYAEQEGGCCKNKCQDVYCSGAHEVKLETPDSKGKCCGCAEDYQFDETLNKCVSISCPDGQCKNAEGECIDIKNDCDEGAVGATGTDVATCVYGQIKDVCVRAGEGSCPSLTKWESKCVCLPGYCGDNCEHAYDLSGSETKEVLTDICDAFQGEGQYCSNKGSEEYEAEMTTFTNYNNGSWLSNLRNVCKSYTGQTALGNKTLVGCVLDDPNYPRRYPDPGTYCVAHTFSGTCACDGSITYHKRMEEDRYEWDCSQEQITAEACENYKSSTTMEDCPSNADSGGGCDNYKGQNCAIVAGVGSGANNFIKCTKCSCVLASAGDWLYWHEAEPVLKCNFGVSAVEWINLGAGACRERTDPSSNLYPDDCNGLEILSQKSDSMLLNLLDSKDIKNNCSIKDGVEKSESANVLVCADEGSHCYLGSVQATCNCAYQ